jgi:alpha-tubulin suppressor-like RCC1 family protein
LRFFVWVDDSGLLRLFDPDRKEIECGRLSEICQVSAGREHWAAVTKTGFLVVWGENEKGQLGLIGTRKSPIPVPLDKGKSFGRQGVRQVACGGDHTLVVTKDGELFAAGKNQHGQLGQADIARHDGFVKVDLKGVRVEFAAAGLNHSAVVTTHGEVFTWGNPEGGLGHGNRPRLFLLPERVQSDFGGDRPVQIAAGDEFTVVLTAAMGVWSCGKNFGAQLGLGDFQDRCIFTHINGLLAMTVACGPRHTLALLPDGSVVFWGTLADKDPQPRPTTVALNDATGAAAVAAGVGCSLVVTVGGSLYKQTEIGRLSLVE